MFCLEWTISAQSQIRDKDFPKPVRYGDWQRHRCPKRLSQIPVARKDCQIVWTAFHLFKRYSTDLQWLPPCLFCASGINRKHNYGVTRSTWPITADERTAICKSQLEAIIKKPGNTQGVGTCFWSLIRRRTIPGFSFVCNAGYGSLWITGPMKVNLKQMR